MRHQQQPNQNKKPTLIIAGGGTGGHVLAGVAVADAWKELYGPEASILFIGAYGGLEEKLVPKAGYRLELLHLGSLNRVSLGRRLKTMIQLPLSLLKSAALVWKTKPDAVLGVGGYSSGPVVLIARIIGLLKGGKPLTAILEQNAVPGFTNRTLGKWVNKIFCAFPTPDGAGGKFPLEKIQVTGNPVRSAMKPLPQPGTQGPFTVFIFGGSQGALGINTLVIDALPLLEDLKPKLRIVHQTGEKDYERVKVAHEKAGFDVRVEKFIYEMPKMYEEASLLICRAGSSTLAEIAAVGRASVLVPFPYASDNHQEKNARIFSDAGAAFLLVQSESNGSHLATIIRDSLAHPEKLQGMAQIAKEFYRPNAASEIVEKLVAR